MRFYDLLEAVRAQPSTLSIPAEWAQGRASFGGLVVALQYEAMRAKVPLDRPLRSLAITFVGPVEPEVPVSFTNGSRRVSPLLPDLLKRPPASVTNAQERTLAPMPPARGFFFSRASVGGGPSLAANRCAAIRNA